MADDPVQPPEGVLLQTKLAATGMSARKAAEEIGISDSRLRHIIRGYQPVGQGQKVTVRAPADTLGRIAYVLEISPAELVEVGRDDAAEAMERARANQLHDRFVWPLDQQQRAQARMDAQEWFRSGMDGPAPKSLLRVVTNSDLVAEVARRLTEGTANQATEVPLSVVPDGVPDAVAAHEEEGSIAGEQEESDTP